MSQIHFYSPLGEDIYNPKTIYLKDLVLGRGKDYWCQGNGQGVFHYTNYNGIKTELVLTFQQSYGFQVEYKDVNSIFYVSLGSGNFIDIVTTYVGGDEWLLPSKFFISIDKTWLAVDSFCTTGERCEQINWGIISEQDWNYRVS